MSNAQDSSKDPTNSKLYSNVDQAKAQPADNKQQAPKKGKDRKPKAKELKRLIEMEEDNTNPVQ